MSGILYKTPIESASPDPRPVVRPSGTVGAAARTALRWLGQAIDTLEQHPVVVILILSALYFWATYAITFYKQLWDDEFFTYYIAEAGFKGTWQALLTGADQHPPTFYWLVHLFDLVFGFGHETFRLPSILAFWSISLLLFRYISRRTSNLMGCAAMLFPTSSHLFYYAVESRGYALLMMFSALAFIAWQAAAAGVRRRLTVPLLGLALVAAFCSHYYAILVLIPLGLGELTRLIRDRRADWAVWLACAAPVIPIILFLPIINGARKYSHTFWAPPSIEVLAGCYHLICSSMEIFACVALAFVWGILGRNASTTKHRPARIAFTLPEVVTLVAFAMIPIFGFVLAHVTHGFWPRYFSPCIVGITILLAVTGHIVSRGSPSFAAAMLFLMILCTLERTYLLRLESRGLASEAREGYHQMLAAAEADEPIAIAESSIFHKLWFYGPRDFRWRISYLSDPAYSIKYLGHDTVDRGLLELKPWFGENVQPFREYAARTPRFLVYGRVGEWTWITQGLLEEHLHAVLVGRHGDRIALQVTH